MLTKINIATILKTFTGYFQYVGGDMNVEISNLTDPDFKAFGVLLDDYENKNRGFKVLVEEPLFGWRIATYNVTDKKTTRLERHPSSKESFEPLYGVGVLIVAPIESPKDFKCFVLDKPVCLHKGIWHQLISLSENTIVKITENYEVDSEFYNFDSELKILLYQGDADE